MAPVVRHADAAGQGGRNGSQLVSIHGSEAIAAAAGGDQERIGEDFPGIRGDMVVAGVKVAIEGAATRRIERAGADVDEDVVPEEDVTAVAGRPLLEHRRVGILDVDRVVIDLIPVVAVAMDEEHPAARDAAVVLADVVPDDVALAVAIAAHVEKPRHDTGDIVDVAVSHRDTGERADAIVADQDAHFLGLGRAIVRDLQIVDAPVLLVLKKHRAAGDTAAVNDGLGTTVITVDGDLRGGSAGAHRMQATGPGGARFQQELVAGVEGFGIDLAEGLPGKCRA